MVVKRLKIEHVLIAVFGKHIRQRLYFTFLLSTRKLSNSLSQEKNWLSYVKNDKEMICIYVCMCICVIHALINEAIHTSVCWCQK